MFRASVCGVPRSYHRWWLYEALRITRELPSCISRNAVHTVKKRKQLGKGTGTLKLLEGEKKKNFVKGFRNPKALMIRAHTQTAASSQTVISTKPLFTVNWTYSFEILTYQCAMCKKAEQKAVPTKKILCLIFCQGDSEVYFFSCSSLAIASCITGRF